MWAVEVEVGAKVPKRHGFTLVELLVVIAIIGILVAILLPALNSVRESARGSICRANLKQIALAMQTFESTRRRLPPGRNGAGGWSAQAVITPFLETGHVYEGINFSVSYKDIDLDGKPISSYRVPIYNCPSEPNIELRVSGSEIYAPINYGVNMGTWQVWDPNSKTGGDGCFFPERGVRLKEIKDGLSNTMMLAEVKTYTPYFRDAAGVSLAKPADAATLCTYGGNFKANSGHTEWVDGRVHQTGFTTTFAPNTVVSWNNADVDFNNQREGNSATAVTYAAVTARSHHPGLEYIATVIGSVHGISNDVELGAWQALSTRAGRETVEPILID